MATTKVIKELTDLNQANSESGLRMPSSNAAYSGPTVEEGMMRNEVGQVSNGSASCMQHYNGTDWKNFVNKPETLSVNYLLVGGGGSGANGLGGGGGGGGLLTSWQSEPSGGGGSTGSALDLQKNTAYTITVGDGGTGGTGNNPTSGGDSIIALSGTDVIRAKGGGNAAGYNLPTGNQGSAGGGAASGSTPSNRLGGTGTTGQGYDGGDSNYNVIGGGGGGAGEEGNTDGTGHGGDGVSSSISPVTTVYAGGGSGGSYNQGNIPGGTGGGGQGSQSNVAGGAGTDNLGGGGGGGGSQSGVGNGAGGDGGKGIIILRYLDTSSITVGSGLTTGVLNGVASTGIGSESYTTFIGGTGTITFS